MQGRPLSQSRHSNTGQACTNSATGNRAENLKIVLCLGKAYRTYL